ncbi:MAG: tetratricopeptide repeat protein [Nevskia sp.]|nr:tetratricopeptide repeat protein [Nevskia sp.]MCK9383617.1 tetratricopeptide repeat protein [Nevskia sp.]
MFDKKTARARGVVCDLNSGIINTGDVHYHLDARTVVINGQPHAASLGIPWRLDPAPEALLSALHWQSRIPRTLYGRDEELADLRRWAEGPGQARVRIVYGEGGVGKTRLAFEFAEILKTEGWEAGQIADPSAPLVFPLAEKGVLLIIDYPEQYPAPVENLLKLIHRGKFGAGRLRVLLLCRNVEAMRAKVDECAPGVQTPALPLPPLPAEDLAWAVFEDGQKAIAVLRDVAVPAPLPRAAFNGWLVQDYAHAQPLIILAYALNLLDEPTATALVHAEILQRLGQREQSRLRKEAEKHRLQADAVLLLKALAAITGALDADAIDALAELPLPRGFDWPTVPALRQSPLWQNGGVPELQPDLIASVFLHQVLHTALRNPATAAPWLWAVLTVGDADAAVLDQRLSRIARLAYDRLRLRGVAETGEIAAADFIGLALVEIIEKDPAAADLIYELRGTKTPVEVPLRRALLAATQARVVLDEQRAAADPATYRPALAGILNILSARLADVGERAGGLAAIQRAVGIYKALAAENFAAYGPDLASSLNNLSVDLANAGDRAGGLAAIQRAVAIREALAAENFAAYGSDLASSLNNLSIHLAERGNCVGGWAASWRSVGIFEALAAQNFAAYGPALAMSLNTLSNRAADVGDRASSLAAIQRAVAIRDALAAENFAAYGPDWALSLNNLALRLAESGDRAGGLVAIQRAVAIREALAAENLAAYGPVLARSLNNLSVDLANAGDRAGGLAASRRAVAICRPFLDENFAAFAPDGAIYLSTLADHLSESGDAADAAEAAALRTEVAAIRARLDGAG